MLARLKRWWKRVRCPHCCTTVQKQTGVCKHGKKKWYRMRYVCSDCGKHWHYGSSWNRDLWFEDRSEALEALHMDRGWLELD